MPAGAEHCRDTAGRRTLPPGPVGSSRGARRAPCFTPPLGAQSLLQGPVLAGCGFPKVPSSQCGERRYCREPRTVMPVLSARFLLCKPFPQPAGAGHTGNCPPGLRGTHKYIRPLQREASPVRSSSGARRGTPAPSMRPPASAYSALVRSLEDIRSALPQCGHHTV